MPNLEQKINVRDSVIKSYYFSKSSSDLEYFIGSESSSFSNLSIAIQAKEKINSSLIDTIKILSQEITEYESDKVEAQNAKKDLETSFANFSAIKTD